MFPWQIKITFITFFISLQKSPKPFIFPVLVCVLDSGIAAQAVNPLKTAAKLLDRFVQIQNFCNRSVSYLGLDIAFNIIFRLVFTGIFPRAVNCDHAGMDTDFVSCTSVIDCVCETVGQYFPDHSNRYFRNLIPLCSGYFTPPPGIFQYIFFRNIQQIINIVLIQFHIQNRQFFIRREYARF